MGPKTPRRVEEKVLELWLTGVPRQEISRKIGVSIGTVLNIIKEAKKNITDLSLLRGLAVNIRKEGWNLETFAPAVRHRNILRKRSLTDEQIDDLIEVVDEHCYKKKIHLQTFLGLLQHVSLTSKKYGVPVESLNELIKAKEDLLTDLENKVADLENKVADLENKVVDLGESYNAMLDRNNITEIEIEQIRKDRPFIERIKELEDENRKLLYVPIQSKAKRISRAILAGLPEGMTYEQINRASKLLLYNSKQLGHMIDQIFEVEDSLPNKPSHEELDE